jgi:hypothetical protein
MRVAYAVLARDDAEVAAALGYWAACWLELGEGVGAAPLTDQPAAVLARVGAVPSLAGVACDGHLLWHFMRATAAQPAFAPVHDWLAVGPDTLERVAADSLALFAATMDFCALHAVTGTHWLRLVLPYLAPADQARAIRQFWQAIAAVYPKMGCPAPLDAAAMATLRAAPCPDWPAIAAAACGSADEHDVSLAFSARAEQARWGDRVYQVVAARRLGLLGPAERPTG